METIYQQTKDRLRKIEKEADEMIEKFNGEALDIAVRTKRFINENILMFENLEKQHG